MKKFNLLFIFYAIFSFALLNESIAQTDNVVIIRDSINENTSLVKVMTNDSLLINQYYVYGDKSNIQFLKKDSTYNSVLYGNDELLATLWLPDSLGGCLPQDVCYNSTNHKYYLFGGRKVVIIDANTNTVIKSLTISQTALFNGMNMFSLLPQHRILYNYNNNKIYCATDGAELVVIDGLSDNIVTTYPAMEINNLSNTSIIINNTTNSIYWMLSDMFQDKLIKKYNCTTNQFELQYTTNEPIYDLACSPDGNKLYVSQAIWFKILNATDFSFIHAYYWKTNPPGTILYLTDLNKVYVDRMEGKAISVIDGITNSYTGSFNINYDFVRLMSYNPTNKYVYCTANDISISNEGVSLINGNSNVEISHFSFNNALGLAKNIFSNKFYCGGNNLVPLTGAVQGQLINTGNRMNYRLAYNEDQQNIITVNNLAGSAGIINSNNSLLNFLQIGGATFKGCYNSNNNKIYFIQDFPPNISGFSTIKPSFISIINGNDNTTTKITTSSFYRGCCYNSKYKKLFVSDYNDNTVKVFDGETNVLLSTIQIPIGYKVGSAIFSASNNKIYLSAYDMVYIINAANNQIITQISTNGCITEFKENTINGNVYASRQNNNVILAIDGVNNTLITEMIIPKISRSLAYNPQNNKLYSANNDGIISIIDGATNNVITNLSFSSNTVKLEYCPTNNKIYGLQSTKGVIVIDGEGNTFLNSISWEGNSYGSTMVYNPVNNRMYIHILCEENLEMAVRVIDCSSDQLCSLVPLNQKIKPGLLAVTWGEDMIYNPVNNKVYCGNYGFSNVSVIDCAPEKMALKTGWTWLSFPRLERKLNETVNAIGVLQNTTPFPGYLNFLGKNGNQQVSLTYSGYTWTSNGLSTIRSTSGYKLYTTNTDPTYVPVSGSVLDPSTSINIYAGYENWIGYFLNKSLTPAEAFGSQMDNLYEIKTQNWTMTKVNNQWISMTGNSPLKYGDMVAVKCYNDASFQWDNSSTGTSEESSLAAAQHFTYTETADYTPVYIELESSDPVEEIGAYAGSECIGAVAVNDTLVELNAYLPDSTNNNRQIDFVKYYGTKSAPVSTGDYWVYNPQTLTKDKRKILCNEHANYQLVSFKEKEELSFTEKASIECYPNPFGNATTIRYSLPEEAKVSVKIYSMGGALINTIVDGKLPKGNYTANWSGKDANGAGIPQGIYLCKMISGSVVYQTKLIYMK